MRKIECHHRAELAVTRRHPTHNAGTAAEWHNGDPAFRGVSQHRQHISLIARIKNNVGRSAEIAGAQPQQIVIRAPQRMERALVIVIAHLLRAQHRDKLAAFFLAQPRCRKRQFFKLACRCRQQAWHADFAGEPCPEFGPSRNIVMRLDQAPAVPADFLAVHHFFKSFSISN